MKDFYNADIVVLTAPSGTGKSTIVKRLRTEVPEIEFSVSHTTRKQRPGEKNGEHYWFIEPAIFQTMVAGKDMLEWADVFGNFYGTSKREIDRIVGNGRKPLLEIDVQGWLQVRQSVPTVKSIFVMPPSMRELWDRLAARGTDSLQVRWRRFKTARQELDLGCEYQYFVVNDQLEQAYLEIMGFITEQKAFRLNREAGKRHCLKLIDEYDKAPWIADLKKNLGT